MPPEEQLFGTELVGNTREGNVPTVVTVIAVHPLKSVTVTVYVPVGKLAIIEFVPPVFQEYRYGNVPPTGTTPINPFDIPGQTSLFETANVIVTGIGAGTFATCVLVQPLLSVTVTV